jgi:DNA-binding NtrC family response regulator
MSHDGADILLVDPDSHPSRELAAELMQRGFKVVTATSAEEALARFCVAPSSVVISELHLPRTDGITLLSSLRARHAGSRFYLTSSQLDIQTTVHAIRAGADDVLEKPLDAAALDDRLRAFVMSTADRQAGSAVRRAPGCLAILGEAPAIHAVREQIRTVARYRDLSVLITGETGTGKELVAQAVHASSETDGPFVPVNCAAIPEHLFESELFGHEAGAFTGARGAHAGLFEVAATGTLFLDEVGELPGSLQPKLLRALETRSFRRVGGTRDLPFRARVISATHRPVTSPDALLRSDLYYRLAGFTIATPALRDRSSDLEILAQHFLAEFGARYGMRLEFSPRALEALHAYDWPGNVRELRAVLQQAAVLTEGPRVGVAELMSALRDRARVPKAIPPPQSQSLKPVSLVRRSEPPEPLRITEQRTILKTWEASGNNLSAAARRLGLPRNTLRDRLRRYGVL